MRAWMLLMIVGGLLTRGSARAEETADTRPRFNAWHALERLEEEQPTRAEQHASTLVTDDVRPTAKAAAGARVRDGAAHLVHVGRRFECTFAVLVWSCKPRL